MRTSWRAEYDINWSCFYFGRIGTATSSETNRIHSIAISHPSWAYFIYCSSDFSEFATQSHCSIIIIILNSQSCCEFFWLVWFDRWCYRVGDRQHWALFAISVPTFDFYTKTNKITIEKWILNLSVVKFTVQIVPINCGDMKSNLGLQWARPENVPYPTLWRAFEAKERKNSDKLAKFVIQDLPEDRFEDAIRHMTEYYMVDHPIMCGKSQWNSKFNTFIESRSVFCRWSNR